MTSEISTFSKKQLKKSLSAKKKPFKSIKHALKSSNNLWPLIKDDEAPYLMEELNKTIHSLLSTNEFTMNDDRSAAENTSNDKHYRKYLQFGINETARCLEKDDCASVLLNADIPRILVSHIITLAVSKGITVLCIPGFRDFLKSHFGFRASVLCINKNISKETHSTILKIINNMNFNTSNVITAKKNIFPASSQTFDTDSNCTNLKTNKITLLYRTNKKERIFNPVAQTPNVNNTSHKNSSTYSSDKIIVDCLTAKGFQPLVITKIKNNVHRPKRVKST